MTAPSVRVGQGGPAVRLSKVVARLEREGLLVSAPGTDPALSGVADDSRRVRPGDLYCAWVGTAVDAHEFVALAEQAGAAAALVERPVAGIALPQVVVTDGRRAAALAASAVYGDPGDALRLVGVTGTNGKTTTVWLMRHLLGLRWPSGSLGTLGVILEDGQPLEGSESLTTPGPVELALTLRAMVDRGIRAAALEVSSHALHQGRVHSLRFDAAVFTNLSRDHLDYHGTESEYLAAKQSLAELLREDGTAVVNADDPAWSGLASRLPRVLRFGLDVGSADVAAADVRLGAGGARFRLVTPAGEYPVELPLLGSFNVQNALGALAACIAMGLDAGELAARLATVPQVPGRLERIADHPCTVLRDYAHTPDAMDRALVTLRPLVAGRLIAVFGAGGDRDRGKRPLMGSIAAALADVPIVTSDNPRTEDPDAIIDDIVAGMAGASYIREVDRRRAIAKALELARPDDLILLVGKGHETYQILGKEKVPFDEREIVSELAGGQASEVGA